MVDDQLDGTLQTHDERRLHDRSRLIIDVFFNGQDATGIASTQDISVGGLYMYTQTKLPEGTLLMIRIPFKDGKQVVVNAEVVYSNPGRGVGVSFQGLSEEDKQAIANEIGND